MRSSSLSPAASYAVTLFLAVAGAVLIAAAAALFLIGLNAKTAHAQDQVVWYLKGVVTLAGGETRETRYVVTGDSGKPLLLTFASQGQCEEAKSTDRDLVDSLAHFTEFVTAHGGAAVVSCEQLLPGEGV